MLTIDVSIKNMYYKVKEMGFTTVQFLLKRATRFFFCS